MTPRSIFKRKEVKALFKRRKTRRGSATPSPTPEPSLTNSEAPQRVSDDKPKARRPSHSSNNNSNEYSSLSLRSDGVDGGISQKARRHSYSAAGTEPRPRSRQRRSSEPDALHGGVASSKKANSIEKRRHTSSSNRSEIDGYVGIAETHKTKKVVPSLSGKRPPIAPSDD